MRFHIDTRERFGEEGVTLLPDLAVWPDDVDRPSLMRTTRGGVTATSFDAPRTRNMKLPANAQVHVTVAFVNANGNPAQVDGAVTWESSDTNIATVMPDTNKSEGATIKAGPSAGTAVITASGDADLGQGVTEVSAEVEVIVIARGQAIGGEIVPDVVSGPAPGVPGAGIDNSLPGVERPADPGFDKPAPGRPDNALPEHGAPKK